MTPVREPELHEPKVVVRYAGFWRRYGAQSIDSLITFTVPLTIYILIGRAATFGTTHDERAHIARLIAPFFYGAWFIISWLYSAIMESSRIQATLGKKAIGLQVTDLEGNRISFARATGRHFAKALSFLTAGIGYMMAGFTEDKQAMHDRIAGTHVLLILPIRSAVNPILALKLQADIEPTY